MTDTPNKVIWIASYPKSGNTWVFNVIRWAAVASGFPNFEPEYFEMMNDGRTPQALPFVQDTISGSANCAVMKTHALNNGQEVHPSLGLETAGIVYIMRNPLDMLLSYINFTRIQYARSPRQEAYGKELFLEFLGFDRIVSAEEWQAFTLDSIPQKNLDHALQVFSENKLSIPLLKNAQESWLNHVRMWKKACNITPGILLRYEDLLSDAAAFHPLGKLFSFSETAIEESVAKVDALTKQSQKKMFFNKMRSHYFHEYFSTDVLKAFGNKFEAELEETGYPDLVQPN